MLCEVGDYVNRTGRHRHTYYIISHSEILGYTPQQRKIIAAIARYLGKSRPAPGDGPIKTLPPSDQKHIAKASLLLRLAWALESRTQRRAETVAGAESRELQSDSCLFQNLR